MKGLPGGVALVIPLQDEEASVDALLLSIAGQALPPTEVIVVDAGSRDRTAERVRSARLPFPTTVVTCGRLHPGDARNAGVRNATTSWIAFTDGGIRLDGMWLSELARTAEATGAGIVFGSYEPVCDSFFKECAALAYVPPRNANGVRGPFVASMLLRRDHFHAVGGFPGYRAAEDLIFLERIRNEGFRSATTAGAVVYWQMAASIAATYRRFKLYSEHNLLARRAQFWHRGVARHHALGAVMAAAFAIAGQPVAAGLAVPFWFLMRATHAAWVKRHSFAFSTLNPLRVLGAAGVLVVTDAATLAGVVRWARTLRLGGTDPH